MGLKSPVPGLRVLHNTHSSEKVEIAVPPGVELIVPPGVARQLAEQRGSFKVDADELAKGLAAEAAVARAAEEAKHAPPEPEAEPVKKAPAKKAAAKKKTTDA